MSQRSGRQAPRRPALNAQAVLSREQADRERRLDALAVVVLTALPEQCCKSAHPAAENTLAEIWNAEDKTTR